MKPPEDILREEIARTVAHLASLRAALREIERPVRQWSYEELSPVIAIASQVAREAGLTISDMVGPDRSRMVATVRQNAYLAARRAGYPFAQIGAALGDRDPKTIMHGVRVAEKRGNQKIGEIAE